MDPFTLGLILSGASGLFGAFGANRAASRQARQQQRFMNTAEGYLQGGPSEAEQAMLDWITGGGQGFDPSHLFSGEGYNTGQDALMQMLRAEPFDTTELFSALEPIEARALDESLAGAWSGASGLGQRFGSATMREEGRVRGEAADNAAARRAGIAQQSYESAANRALTAGQTLTQAGAQEAATGLQALQQLFAMGQGRQGANMNILAMMAGMQPTNTTAPFAQFGGEMGQLLMLLPMLRQLNAPPTGPAPA